MVVKNVCVKKISFLIAQFDCFIILFFGLSGCIPIYVIIIIGR